MGCSADIALSWRLCFTVSGIMIARITRVKMTMANPKLLKKTPYSSRRLLIIGSMMIAFQMSPIMAKA